jgi:hypothetical protein
LPDETPTKKDHPATARGRPAKGTDEPVYISIQHPDWTVREMDFVFKHSKAGLPDKLPDAIGEPELADYAGRLADPAKRDRAICELIEKVGPEVFWLPGPGESGQLVLAAVQQRISAAYDAARSGTSVSERGAAVSFLRGVGKALAGDRRGRREGVVLDTLQVRNAYYRTFFRLERFRELLKAWPWTESRSRQLRIRKLGEVASVCGLDKAEVERLFFNHAGEWHRPLTTAEAARIWTANELRVTQQTVSNHLAPSALRPSRK